METDRLQELKDKIKEVGGYLGLSKEEKEEYQALKDKPAEAVKPVELPNKNTVLVEDRIQKLEQMVNNLSKENSNLREETAKMQEGWGEYVPPSQQNKTATLKVYRKDSDSPAGLIVKVTTFKNNAFNEETRKNDRLIYNITLRYDDGKEAEEKIDAMDLSKIREIEKVEIVKEDSRILRKVEDYVTIPQKDKEGYPKRMLDGGSGYGQNIGANTVPLEVFMVKSTVVVKRKNGQEFSMSSDYLNL